MMNKKRIPIFALITLLALLVNLVFPTVALADGGETPTPAPTEETAIVTESAPEAVVTEESAPPAPTDEETPEETEQVPPISEALAQVPENTDVIVLDENGEALPLVTQEAEEVIAASDPVWCPNSVAAPTPGENDCSPTQTSMTDLLAWLAANTPNQAGTIWIEDSYDSSIAAGDAGVVGFTLNGATLSSMAAHSLTIQGGWDGISGSNTITGDSTFNGDYLHVINWTGDVTINNIFVNAANDNGIEVQTRGSINLDNVTSSNNTGSGSNGAYLVNNLLSTGSISVTNSTFNNNAYNGVWADSHGNITLNNVTAINNIARRGAFLNNAYLGYTNEISVTNGTFNNNHDYGLYVSTYNNITLNNVTANGNFYSGAILENYYGTGVTGTISITDGTFNGNNDHGLDISSKEDITLNNVTANGNQTGNGALLNNSHGTGNIFIINGAFNGNSDHGLDVLSKGNITLNNVTANGNQTDNGALLNNSNGTGNVSITDGTFNGNNNYGLDALSNGDITLNNVTANGNQSGIGALLNNANGTGNLFVTNGQFNYNFGGTFIESGLTFITNGNVSLNGITANGNGIAGILSLDFLDPTTPLALSISANNISASNNGIGIVVASNGQTTISDIVANNNLIVGGAFFSTGISIINGQFNNHPTGAGLINFAGDIYLENIVATGNGTGAQLEASGTATIQCSTFSDNITGLELDAPQLNLIGVTLSNNGTDIDDQTTGGSTITTSALDCNPVPSDSTSTSKSVTGTGLPLQIVNGNNAELDCDNYSGTVLILPNGDKITFKCPIDGSVILNPLADADLENPLPDDFEYASGMLAIQSPDGSDVPLDGLVIVDFVIPAELQGADFAILYWNGTEWLDLADLTSQDFNNDGRSVYNSGYVTADGYFQAVTNFSGNFVLVTK